MKQLFPFRFICRWFDVFNLSIFFYFLLFAICFLFWIKAIWFNGCDLGNKHGFEANNFSDLYKKSLNFPFSSVSDPSSSRWVMWYLLVYIVCVYQLYSYFMRELELEPVSRFPILFFLTMSQFSFLGTIYMAKTWEFFPRSRVLKV